MKLETALAECGIIAILRGVVPDEAVAIAQTLFDAGVRIVEVPLNSPDPFTSIARMAQALGDRLVIGAGTVLSLADVNMLKSSGGEISVSPDCNPDVIGQARKLGLEPFPGVFTPTEAFAAIRAGARHLKLFPAEVSSPQTVKAWRAVLPNDVKIHAVGGVTTSNMRDWLASGVSGFGIGSSLYKPGFTPEDVGRKASELVTAFKEAKAGLK